MTPTAATRSATRRQPPVSARDRLLSAALDRFGSDGTVAVSLEEIRQEAGVSVGALYHHFADKSELFDALYVDVTDRFQIGFLSELRSSPGAREGIERGVRFYLRWVSRRRREARIQLGDRPDSPELRELNRRFFKEVTAWWDTHAHYGTLRPLPLDLIHALWLGPAEEYARQWLAGHTRRQPAAVAELLADAAWNSLKEAA